MLYAYRESSRAQAKANDHIVKGWTWSAAKQANTCAACLALDGSFHTLDERLDDHYNGRCSAVPITKTWEELGYPGLKETTRQRQTGEEWLREQPPGVQDKILGRAGGKAWRAGQVELGDAVGYRIDPAYGRMVSRKAL